MASPRNSRTILPGFGLSLGFTLAYLGLIVLVPLSAAFVRTAGMSWHDFVGAVWAPRVIAAYKLTFGASLAAGLVNMVFGLVVAWVLVRYSFPGKKDRGRPRGPAVRAADRGRGHCAHLALLA
jgi:sulfate transport system permease protein